MCAWRQCVTTTASKLRTVIILPRHRILEKMRGHSVCLAYHEQVILILWHDCKASVRNLVSRLVVCREGQTVTPFDASKPTGPCYRIKCWIRDEILLSLWIEYFSWIYNKTVLSTVRLADQHANIRDRNSANSSPTNLQALFSNARFIKHCLLSELRLFLPFFKYVNCCGRK